MSGSFLDTDVLIYVASADAEKANVAERLLGAGGTISVQVLNEIANVARRKMAMSWDDIRAFLSALRALLPVQPLTAELHEAGLALAERYGFSVYDAMIVAAALEAGCETLWSEDMKDGMIVEDRLRIANPFLAHA
jgi:predicted nucleic acid-binding protein